jgi:DNA uptake protein ComE-like DNA-binding protein
MAKRAPQQRRTTRNQWVPRGLDKPASEDIAPKPPSKSGDTDEWLAIPRHRASPSISNGHLNGNLNGQTSDVDLDLDAEPPPRPLKKRKLPKRATARERWLINRLRRSKQRVEEQEEEIDRLKDGINKLRTTEREPTPKPAARITSKGTQTRAKASTGSRKTAARSKKIDLQEASFEDLRGLGLSVTQSARLIAYREAGRGFESVDDLNTIPGFTKATLGKLRERLRVGTR